MNQKQSTDPGKPKILMYSTGMCSYCARAETLLRKKGSVSIEKLRIDLDATRREEMLTRTGKRTVPQIYIGATYVGGYEELRTLDRAGKLGALLAGAHA